jgi:hypothetical protein
MSLRKHLTYANVVSSLCLFLLFGGAAYAGTHLAKGSVGTQQLKAEAVTKGKLAPDSVNSKKVVNGSLTGEDIASSTLGTVPSATDADHANTANSANSATTATSATSADHATTADKAADAEKLDGHGPGEFGAVLVSNPNVTGTLQAEMYFSVSGTALGSTSAKFASTILPSRGFRASDFAVHFEGAVQAGLDIRVSLVVDETPEEVCTLTEVPSTCTPSTTAIEIPPAAQVAWQITGTESLAARPQFALRLGPS